MKRTFFYILSLLLLAACSDVIIVPDGGNGIDANSSITVKLALPLWEQSEVRSRAVTENALSGDVTVLFFDSEKVALGKESVTPKVEDTKYTITINAPKGTKYLHIVANAPSGSFATANDPATEATSVAIDGYLTYWGYADITSLLQTGATVTLIPDCARFEAESSVDGFTIGGIKLINTANKGYIAPAEWNYSSPTPNVPADVAYNGTSGDCTSTTIYCFEAAAGQMRVIVKGTYGGVEGYYKAALIGSDGNEIAVLRNHSYTLKVTSVNHVGYSTEEAAESAPEANIKVEVVDNESEIVNLTSDGKDLLGVSKDVTVEATATSATIKVFTTLSEAPICDFTSEWIQSGSFDGGTTVNTVKVDETTTQSEGKLYTLTLTLSQNSESDQSRTAEVTIRSGQMSRVVKVTQSGADFSTEREIHRVASGTETTLDLKALMMSVKGLFPQYNQGVVRHIGLHFEPFRNDIYFKIKKIAGDETPSGNEYFTVSENGDYWEVKLNTSLENYSSALWTSSFSIKNGTKTYNYPVYHCGLFHKMSDDKIYYYEVVKVTGKSGKVYNILDRNLRATRNDFYSPETSALESYSDACGGYFKIAESKADGCIESSIVPSGYEIPTDAILEDLNILTEIATASNGDQYTRVYLATCGDSQIERIYLPLAGYYEDVEHKNTTHCNLWSKSLLAGTQGFSKDSAEYGYWYRYLDFVGSKQVISNMRFVTGSNGTSTGRYKTMPVRCIHP